MPSISTKRPASTKGCPFDGTAPASENDPKATVGDLLSFLGGTVVAVHEPPKQSEAWLRAVEGHDDLPF